MKGGRRGAALALVAAAALAGCGEEPLATDLPPATPAGAAAPQVPVRPVGPGEVVRPGPTTPAPVVRALAGDDVIVIGFVLTHPADDRASAHALTRLRRRGPGADGVAHFLYAVDRSRAFGDLPELLGVESTPTVVVIGRDRRIANRFTGWVDGGVLRQAVAEAKAGRGTAGPARPAGAPAGDRAGIALARRVNARYAHVPGIRMSGSAIDDRLGPAEVTLVASLRRGRIRAWSGRFAAGGARLEMVADADAFRARAATAPCWASIPASDAVLGVGDPMVPLDGHRLSAPDPAGEEVHLRLTRQDGDEVTRATYRIDRRTLRVIAVEDAAVSVTLTDLPAAPPTPTGEPPCSDPAAAFGGLGEASTP